MVALPKAGPASRRAAPLHSIVIATVRREALLRSIASTLRSLGISADVYMDVHDVPSVPADLIVLGPKDEPALTWARTRAKQGALVIPDPDLTAQVVDRVSCRSLLQQAGLSAPAAVSGVAGALAHSIHRIGDMQPPFVIKRRFEHGVPIAAVETLDEADKYLKSLDRCSHVVIEQHIVGPQHLTAYVLGPSIVLFERPAFGPAESETIRLDPPPADIEHEVGRFRALTGLLFGKLDAVRRPGGSLCWLDVGVFPRFEHIPEAPTLIGGLIHARLMPEGRAQEKRRFS